MTMIDELIKSVTKRLDKFLLNKMLCVSTFLDPRYNYFVNMQMKMLL